MSVDDQAGVPPQDEDERATRGKAALERVVRTDSSPRFLKIAKWLRQQLPGDSELGDALSTAGDEPSLVIARRLSELGAERPSVTRELGLGALQVFQALSEAQGRGRGEREVAILFTDLVDFSPWALEAGDDDALELLRRVRACEEAAVTANGGRVVKHLGDGMMAAFNEPESAVTAALEALRQTDAIDVDGYRPKLRAGVHLGRPRKMGGDYLGVDVNVAARVAGAARAGELLVSDVACERLDEGAFTVKRRRFKAKGAPKELEVFTVEATSSSA
jgi:adenylate cyclase